MKSQALKFFNLIEVANGEHPDHVRNVHYVRINSFLIHSKFRGTSKLDHILNLIRETSSKDLSFLFTIERGFSKLKTLTSDGYCVAARKLGWQIGSKLIKEDFKKHSKALSCLESFCFQMQRADRCRRAHIGQVMLEVQAYSDERQALRPNDIEYFSFEESDVSNVA